MENKNFKEEILLLFTKVGMKVVNVLKKIKSKITNLGIKIQIENPKYIEKRKNIDKERLYKVIGLFTICLCVLIVLLSFNSLFGGRSYKKTVDIFVDSSLTLDTEKLIDIMPESLVEVMKDEFRHDNPTIDEANIKSRMASELRESMKDTIEDINEECGIGWDYSHKIIEEEDYTQEEMDKRFAKYYMFQKTPIKQAKRILVSISITKQGKEIKTQEAPLITVKIGRNWYIMI